MLQQQMRQYYFMSGLPRAGSTLLSAILNQNPRFYSGPSSPVVPTMLAIENSLSNDELFLAYPKTQQGARIIASVIDNYYSDVSKPVIFDKNRSWVNRLHYIPGYFGIQEPKVLCPVRNIDEILASFIAMQRRNTYNSDNTKINFIDEMLIKSNIPLTDDNRCEFLASPMGILGQSYNGIKQALMEGKQKSLHFVEYDDLINNPVDTMRKIYEFLSEEYFEHDFSNIENIHRERDAEVYGMPDMHDVRQSLGRRGIDPREYLSEATLAKCKNAEFWRGIDQEGYDAEDFKPDDEVKTTDEPANLIGA